MKNFKFKHFINYALVGALLLMGIIMFAVNALPKSTAALLSQIGFSIILAVSLNLVVGFLGELSLGHAGFMCVGAYLGGYVAKLFVEGGFTAKLPVLLLSMLVGGICAAIFGFIIGLPSLRLKGDYLAIATLAFGEIVRTIFRNQEFLGGSTGLDTEAIAYDTRKAPTLFIFVFVLALFMLWVFQNLIKSKHGRAITAIRDNEIAAKSMGINVTFYKLFVFIISSFFAGCAGVVFAHWTPLVQPSAFSYNYSIDILVMVVLGGMGSITGSIISASFITTINYVLLDKLPGDLAAIKNVVYAVILVIVVIFGNAPALKSFRERYSISAFTERFRKKDVSSHRDDEAKWARVPTKIKMDALLSTDLAPDSDESIHGDISANDKGGEN